MMPLIGVWSAPSGVSGARLGRLNVVLPSPPYWTPRRLNRAVLALMGRTCPWQNSQSTGGQSAGEQFDLGHQGFLHRHSSESASQKGTGTRAYGCPGIDAGLERRNRITAS